MKNIACKNKIVSMVPSIITLLNACSGFIGILLVIVGYAHHQLSYINMAFYSIFFSILFDILDGLVARQLKVTSEIGAELDSLCDAISFGVVPITLFMTTIFYFNHPTWIIVFSTLSSLIYLGCVLYRISQPK